MPPVVGRSAACTVVARRYWSFARVLARSFRQHHPDIPFVVLLADEPGTEVEAGGEPFELVVLSDLGVPDVERLRFTYAQQPLTYACTPWLLAWLLRRGFDRVVFFKQETMVLAPVDSLFAHLASASVVLAPHLLTPPRTIAAERELNILQSGTFNVGTLGVSQCDEARRFLGWWQDCAFDGCRHDVAAGMHYEQRWLDLAPAYFPGVRILRDSAYNVGHWNLPERRIALASDGSVLVDGAPGRVFRFSGYRPERPTAVTQYNSRLSWASAGDARAVFNRFREALLAEGYAVTSAWPYAYETFDNGVAIPDAARWLYLRMGDVARFGDPRLTGSPESYWHWLTASADGQGSRVTRLWHEAVYRTRPDLQMAFPAVLTRDADRFLAWAAAFGAREHGIPPALVPSAGA